MTEQEKNNDNNTPAEVQIPLAELIKIRRDKVRQLRESNINAYPYRYDRTHLIGEALEHFDEFAEKATVIRLAGRIMLKRKMGKSFFADLRDSSERIQIYLKLDIVGQEAFDLFNTIDLADIVGCEGTLFVTRTGERLGGEHHCQQAPENRDAQRQRIDDQRGQIVVTPSVAEPAASGRLRPRPEHERQRDP